MPDALGPRPLDAFFAWVLRRIRLLTMLILFGGVWLIASDASWISITFAGIFLFGGICCWLSVASWLWLYRKSDRQAKVR